MKANEINMESFNVYALSKVSTLNISFSLLVPVVIELVNILEAKLIFFFVMMLFSVYVSIFHFSVSKHILNNKNSKLNVALLTMGYALKSWNYMIPFAYSVYFIYLQLEYIALKG